MPIKTVDAALERLLVTAQRRSTAVLATAAALAVAAGILISRVTFDANVLRLLPRDAPTVQAFERFLVDFGSLDHLYVVFESSDAIGGHAELVQAFVEALRKAPEVESVDAALFEEGKDWNYLYDRELALLGPADASEALSRLRPPALDRELAHARDLLQTPSSEIKTLVQQDPLGMLTILRNRFARQKGFVQFDPTQEGYVSLDGRSRLVIVKPQGAPFDIDFCKALFSRLAEIEKATRASVDDGAGGSTVKIQAAGAYRVSVEAESVIRRETIVNSIGSLVLLVAIIIAVFRTPWMIVYGTVPLALAAALALGLAGVVVGRLSPATSGSAAMLFGLGIDGIALLYMRHLEERERGALPEEASKRMAGTAVSVLLAQVTTAATFLALLLIDFPTLNDLGGLVGVGIFLSCVFTLVLVPALLARNGRTRGRALTTTWLGDFVVQHSRRIVVAGVVATVSLGLAATRLRVDMSLERLQAKTGGPDLEREVAEKFSLPLDVLLVVNDDPNVDRVIDVDARLAQAFARGMPDVAVGGISLLMPTTASQQTVADAIRPWRASLDGVARDLRAGAVRAGFRQDAFQPFIDRLPRLLDPDARITYEGLMAHGLGPVVSRFITRRDGNYVAVTYLYPQGAADVVAIQATIQTVDPRLQLSGLPAIDRELGRRFPREFVKGLVIGTTAVALLIYAAFRSVRRTLLSLLPTAAGFVWAAGGLAIAGVELDLFSMFAVVTCVGIAVNYGIYVLSRYVEGFEDVREVLSRTGAAILIACSTAVVGFGTLMNSSYGPLRMFGVVSVALLLSCLVASLLLLPAILVQTRSPSKQW